MNKLVMMMSVLVVFLAACQITVQQPGQQQTISVNGMSQLKVAPDEAIVMLRVETNGTTAKEAQNANSESMAAIQRELKRAGVTQSDMETINYNLYPHSYWDQKEQRMIEAGYKASHTLQFKTRDLKRVGEFIEVGVNAGATNIDGVNFGLSKQTSKDAKDEAVRQAVQEARQKAEALADGLDARLGKVMSVTMSQYDVVPVYGGMYAEAQMMRDALPPILEKGVDVTANVQVVFEIA